MSRDDADPVAPAATRRHDPTRRRVLHAAACLACAAVTGKAMAATRDDDPRRLPPQPGDALAWPSWEEDDRLVRMDDLVVGGEPLLAYPRDAASGTNRERSRLNQVLLLRYNPDDLDDATRARSLDGIIAYSGVCTHAACGVSEWDAAAGHLVCPCHGSSFDPRAAGARVSGPAPRALPTLPLALSDDVITVAGAFSARVGAEV